VGADHRLTVRPLPRRIVGYHLDDERHWVAELECGHGQHVRHDPPWQVREWVTTESGRAAHLGTILYCVRCVEEGDPRDTTR
jgi:hypothetical protein